MLVDEGVEGDEEEVNDDVAATVMLEAEEDVATTVQQEPYQSRRMIPIILHNNKESVYLTLSRRNHTQQYRALRRITRICTSVTPRQRRCISDGAWRAAKVPIIVIQRPRLIGTIRAPD